MDANKIKFVDDDGTVEVLEPPMTARIHVETPTRPKTPDLEGIQEEDHLLKDVVEIISSSVEEQVTVKSEVEDAMPSVEEVASSVEDAVEQHIKEIEKMDNVLLAASQGTPEVIKMEEVKVPEEIDKEALSLVANAVQEVRASERVPITPKGCCILQ
jgi:hypothetical protein